MSILQHPQWPIFRPYFKIETYARDGGHHRPRVRIEVADLPSDLALKAQHLKMKCVCCGATIYPIRARAGGKNKRSTTVGRHMYYAPTCPLNVNTACSRGKEARDEYIAVKNAVHTGTGDSAAQVVSSKSRDTEKSTRN